MNKKLYCIAVILVLLLLAGCSSHGATPPAGSVAVTVPNVVGLDKDEAESKCSNAGFQTETIFVESHEPANIVIQTDPAANTKAAPSSTIKLFCSKAASPSVKVPDIIGKSLDEAKTVLSSKGLKIGNISYESSGKPKDTVILSDPLPGCTVENGSAVDLTLSAGPKSEPTLEISVTLPPSDKDVELTVYVDGELDESKTSTVDTSVTEKVSYQFHGAKGTKEVRVFIDDVLYRSYTLDFDNQLVTER